MSMSRRIFGPCDQMFSTAGLDPQYTRTKNQFPNKPKGLHRQIQDHVGKDLGEENLDLLGLFCVIKKTPEQNYTKQNWIRLVKYSCAKVSGPSGASISKEIDFLVFKEVKLVYACLIIECLRVQVILS